MCMGKPSHVYLKDINKQSMPLYSLIDFKQVEYDPEIDPDNMEQYTSKIYKVVYLYGKPVDDTNEPPTSPPQPPSYNEKAGIVYSEKGGLPLPVTSDTQFRMQQQRQRRWDAGLYSVIILLLLYLLFKS